MIYREKYVAFAEWTPKMAVDDNYRLTTREVTLGETLKGIDERYQKDFLNVDLREKLCQRIATR
jgi:hypothetical protein